MARFMRKGTTKLFFVPTISAFPIVTAAQVNAGTDLTPQTATITGFSFANAPIMVPDMANSFVSQIPGEDASVASDIEFYQLKGTDAIRTAQAKGTAGWVCILYDGTAGASPAAADKADVWPVTIGSVAKSYMADNSAAKYKVSYSVTAIPAIEVSLT